MAESDEIKKLTARVEELETAQLELAQELLLQQTSMSAIVDIIGSTMAIGHINQRRIGKLEKRAAVSLQDILDGKEPETLGVDAQDLIAIKAAEDKIRASRDRFVQAWAAAGGPTDG